jgi:hypothetical protein
VLLWACVVGNGCTLTAELDTLSSGGLSIPDAAADPLLPPGAGFDGDPTQPSDDTTTDPTAQSTEPSEGDAGFTVIDPEPEETMPNGSTTPDMLPPVLGPDGSVPSPMPAGGEPDASISPTDPPLEDAGEETGTSTFSNGPTPDAGTSPPVTDDDTTNEPADAGVVPGAERCDGTDGCAKLSVPLSAADDRTLFIIQLPELVDLSGATLTYHVYVASAIGGRIFAFIQHGGDPDYNLIQGGSLPFGDVAGWRSITWNIEALSTGFDKTRVGRIGIEIAGAGSTQWSNPTVVYLDSITVSGADVGPFEFDSADTLSPTGRADNQLWLSTDVGETTPGSTMTFLPP